jgi:hypothetical protein
MQKVGPAPHPAIPGLLQGVDGRTQLGDDVPARAAHRRHPLGGLNLPSCALQALAQFIDDVIWQLHGTRVKPVKLASDDRSDEQKW